MGGLFDFGSLGITRSSKDRRQINRATIGEGTIIIRSDPNAGLEGLNRDLARAQEITKDSETAVSVYIDSDAIKEVASGFEGIRSNLEKVAELVKKAMPDGVAAKSLHAQVELMNKLVSLNVPKELAEKISTENPYVAEVISELDDIAKLYGGLETVPEAEAEKILSSLRENPKIAVLVAAGEGANIVISEARSFMIRLLGAADQAGNAVQSSLLLVDDLCKYTISMATGGAVFAENRDRVVAMTQNVWDAAKMIASIDGWKQMGQAYVDRCENIRRLEQAGKYDEASYEQGRLAFDVAAPLEGAATAGKLVIAKGSSLANVVSTVKGSEALAAASEAGGAAVAKGGVKVIEGALPNAERAVVDAQKITSYALDPMHPVGGNKAVVFESALGYNKSNAGELIAKVQEGVRTNPAVLGKADQFGQRFTVDMPITGPNGNTVTVRTGWIFDPGSSTPRLTTLYVK